MTIFEDILKTIEGGGEEVIESLFALDEKLEANTFTDPELKRLFDIAMVHYVMGLGTTGSTILALAATGGPLRREMTPKCPYLEHMPTDSLRVRRPQMIMEFLRDNDIVEESDTNILVDAGAFSLGDSKSYREGYLFLTKRKLIFIGPVRGLTYHDDVAYKLFYDDIEQRKYLNSMDILELSRISNVRLEWGFRRKEIVISYKTGYFREKGRILYGPLFFKWDLPKKMQALEGHITVRIELMDMLWKNLPKDYRKSRHEVVVDKIKTIISGIEII